MLLTLEGVFSQILFMVSAMNSLVIRERTPFWFMVYGVYLYFCSTSLRRASRALGPWVVRSHVAVWKWIQRLSCLAERFTINRREVRCILVDETYIRLGPLEAWLWLALDPENRKFLGFHLSRTRNILVAYQFLMELRRRYGGKPLYTDGANWYPLAARWARLRHTVYDDDLKNIMERFVETVKDRLECFDDYFPCLREGCDHAHIHNWFSVYALIYNHIRGHTTLGRPPRGDLEDIEETERLQSLLRRTLS